MNKLSLCLYPLPSPPPSPLCFLPPPPLPHRARAALSNFTNYIGLQLFSYISGTPHDSIHTFLQFSHSLTLYCHLSFSPALSRHTVYRSLLLLLSLSYFLYLSLCLSEAAKKFEVHFLVARPIRPPTPLEHSGNIFWGESFWYFLRASKKFFFFLVASPLPQPPS